jgi:WhiB family redox-sensing transcriptional regulator
MIAPATLALDWERQAACRDHPKLPPTEWDLDGSGNRGTAALQVCTTCPVREACLEHALEWNTYDQWGIWGGLYPNERRAILRCRTGRCRHPEHHGRRRTLRWRPSAASILADAGIHSRLAGALDDPDLVALITRLAAAGHSDPQIAARAGWTAGRHADARVRRIRARHHIPPGRPRLAATGRSTP